MKAYLTLAFVVLLSPLMCLAFHSLDQTKRFSQLSYSVKQIIYGTAFGILAIIGTEFGIPMDGAQINCRDAAVVSAGLFFGGPAGLIAGFIGGIERWFSVYWGVGAFTREACTIATIFTGFISYFIWKFRLEKKRPTFVAAGFFGLVTECFHMIMVFLTNLDQTPKAMEIVLSITAPMLIGNTLSVMLCSCMLYLVEEKTKEEMPSETKIFDKIVSSLSIYGILIFFLMTLFLYQLENGLAIKNNTDNLVNAVENVRQEVLHISNNTLLDSAYQALDLLVNTDPMDANLKALARYGGLTIINIVDKNGVIINSSDPQYIGFDFHSASQSAEFLCLLNEQEYFTQELQPLATDPEISWKFAGVRLGSGFLQVGIDAERLKRNVTPQVQGILSNYRLGNSGYILLLDQDDQILSYPTWVVNAKIPDTLYDYPENTVRKDKIDGEKVHIHYSPAESFTIVGIAPESDIAETSAGYILTNFLLEVLVFALIFFLVFSNINHQVVDPIGKIAKGLNRITSGHLDEVVNVRGSHEFNSLSDDINATVNTLKGHIEAEKHRNEQEMTLAKTIQASALVRNFPPYPKHREFDIYAHMDPAKEVGGDFYDLYITDDKFLNFSIADVSGKGIPAALFMMRAKAELKSLTESGIPINDVFTECNTTLCDGNEAGMFVTAWQGCLDLQNGSVRYANAGHNPPLIKRGNGNFEYLRSRAGFVLAGMESVHYRLMELELQPGDIIFIYTDGVTEATNDSNELYGEDRLKAILDNCPNTDDMLTLCQKVTEDIADFVGKAPQFDDMTMMALRFLGKPEVPSIRFDPGTAEDVTRATEFIEQHLQEAGCPIKVIYQLNIAIDEIFSNIIKYAYGSESGPIKISVSEDFGPHSVSLIFEDHGVPFNPLPAKDPNVNLSAEERSIGGLGIYIVKKTMDDIRYRYEGGKNILTLIKILEKE